MELNDRQCRGRCLAGVNNQPSRNTKHCPLPPPTPSQSEGFDSRVKKIWECCQLCSMACISHLDGNPQGSKTPSPRQESQRALQWQLPMLQTFEWGFINLHILCRPLLLLPPIPPSIRVFSNESTLRMRWSKYWSFSFSIIPSKEIPGLISFRMD